MRKATWIFLLALGSLTAVGHQGAVRGGPDPTRRPNVLIVVVDDQRATGGTLRVMPRTRRWLGNAGVRFTRAFSTTPLCCPARASIFSGRYAHNHGVWTNLGRLRFDHSHTIQDYLDAAGYRTAIAGKFFNNWSWRKRPPHFDRWAVFDGGYYGAEFNVNGNIVPARGYSTAFIGRKSVDFLEAFEKRDGRPWMLYAAPYAPHAPFIARSKYVSAPVPRWRGNPAVFERDRSDKHRYVRIRNETYATWRHNRKLQLRTLMSVDDMMAKIASRLRSLGEARNTLVFYLSDNGYMWADHGLFDKGAPYTPSIRIPMLMRWPGHVGSERFDRRLVANVDIAPTVLDAAGIDPAPGRPMDGRSLFEEPWTRDRILTEYRNNDNEWTPPTWASLRSRDVQYVEYYDDGRRIFREYYDLSEDPWQLDNLLRDGRPGNDPSAWELMELSTSLGGARRCVGATCP